MKMLSSQKRNSISYKKWGYIFLVPFFVVYTVFSLIPLFSTVYYSFFENYMSGLKQIGPNYVGIENYKTILLETDLPKYAFNTIFIWLLGFIPQIVVAVSYTHLDVYKRQAWHHGKNNNRLPCAK